MRLLFRIQGLAAASTVMVALAAGPAVAQFTDDQLKCRATIAKSGTKLAKTALKTISLCHKNRNTDIGLDATNCNDMAIADIDSKVVAAVGKFTMKVTDACAGQTPANLLYEACPAPCSQAVPVLADMEEVADCLACVVKAAAEDVGVTAFTEPDPALEKPAADCHRSVTLVASKLVASILKAVAKCQAEAEKDGATSVAACTDTNYATIVQEAVTKSEVTLANAHCAGIALPDSDLDACGLPDTLTELVSCVVDGTDAHAQTLATALLSLPAENVTTTSTSTTSTSTTTSTTLPPADPQCPAWADLTLREAGSGIGCSIDDDCTAPYTCDSGKCTTATEDDLGWTGLAHDNDSNDGEVLRVGLHCEGPAAPGCGTCTVTGIDPDGGYCRCSNDTRTVCDEPFASSPECGGNVCNCYLSTPTPVTATGTPVCMVRRLASDVDGTIDVDAGTQSLSVQIRQQIHLGILVAAACPTCGGTCADDPEQFCDRDADCDTGTCNLDAVANDGLRGGTCTGGASAGLTCDVMTTNGTFPAYPIAEGPNGGGYSLDCMPSNNISGAGLLLDLELGTGVSSLPSSVSCGGFAPELDCPCRVCSGETSVSCSSETDCSGQQGRCSGASQVRCGNDAQCQNRNIGPCLESINRCQQALSIGCASDGDCDSVDVGTCNPSTCSGDGFGASPPLPNFCDDLACTDTGGGEGECTTGPDNLYCNGVLKADGSGVYLCQTNFDCSEASIGVDAGQCTLSKRLECFPAPLTASGTASDTHPVVAATYCVPPTANTAANDVAGLAGPARTVQQLSIVSYCGSNPAVPYTPDTGGCP